MSEKCLVCPQGWCYDCPEKNRYNNEERLKIVKQYEVVQHSKLAETVLTDCLVCENYAKSYAETFQKFAISGLPEDLQALEEKAKIVFRSAEHLQKVVSQLKQAFCIVSDTTI